jgi:hypothetical protein
MTYDGTDMTKAESLAGLVEGLNVRTRASFQHRPVQVGADTNLILWTEAPAPTPGGSDDLYLASQYSYFALNPDTGGVTVTLPNPSLMDWPLTFTNNGTQGEDVTFQSQQSPSVRTDSVTGNALPMDGFKLNKGSTVTIAPSLGAASDWDLLWHDMYYEREITSADSPYTAGWWDRNIHADATGGAITVNLTAVLQGLPWTTYVRKTDASGNVVTADGVALTTQGDVSGHRYTGLDIDYEVLPR